jgi:hypothetical protein
MHYYLPTCPQIYNRRLDERERRRQFVLDRGLLNVKRQQAIDKRRSAAERELHGSLRVLARHLPQDQYEALAEGVAVSARGWWGLRQQLREAAGGVSAAGCMPNQQLLAAPSPAWLLARLPCPACRLSSGYGLALLSCRSTEPWWARGGV